MRILEALILTLIILVAQAPSTEPVEASQSSNLSIESKSSLTVKSNWSSNLTGTIDIFMIVNASRSYTESKAKIYAALSDRRGELNFTLNMDYNMSKTLEEDIVKSTTNFKLVYTDYGALARITPTRQATIEITGSTVTVIAGELNSTLKATAKPNTGNRLYNAILASVLVQILNETLNSLKEELQRVNATLEYNVTLTPEGTAVKIEVEAVIPVKEGIEVTQLKLPEGTFNIKTSIKLELDQTTVHIELEVLEGRMDGESLRESIKTLSSMANLTPNRIEETLDRVDRLLESLNNLATTLNNTLTGIEMKPGVEEVVAPQTPAESPYETAAPIETTTPDRQGGGRTTLTLLLMGVITVAILATSYMILTRRGKPFS